MNRTDFNGDSRFLIAHSQGPRDEQQDAGICLHDDERGTALLVIGDGVGGRSGGRIASQKLKALAAELWNERKGNFPNPGDELATLCRVAHEHINDEGAKLGISPRTTVVALYLTPTRAFWTHSGDSRLYHFRGGKLLERTEDHSLLEMMVQRGAVKEEDMGSHPEQATLLQSLGGTEFMPPSVGSAMITPDDGFLLCTDGFWERTKPEEMLELVFAPIKSADGLLSRAIDRAVERNGPRGDNVTAALALPSRQKPCAAARRHSRRTLMLAGAGLFLLGVVLLYGPIGKTATPATGAPVPVSAPPPPVTPPESAPAASVGKPALPADAVSPPPASPAPSVAKDPKPGEVNRPATPPEDHPKPGN